MYCFAVVPMLKRMANGCHRSHWTNLKSFAAHTVMVVDLVMVWEVLATIKTKPKHMKLISSSK